MQLSSTRMASAICRPCGGPLRHSIGIPALRQGRYSLVRPAAVLDGHVVTDAAAAHSSSNGSRHAGRRGGGGGQRPAAAAAPTDEAVPCFHELFRQGDEEQSHQQHAQHQQHKHKQHRRRRSAAADPAAQVHVSIVCAVEYGQSLAVVGAPAALGSWQADHARPLAWHEGHRWTADVALGAGTHEFKFVLLRR